MSALDSYEEVRVVGRGSYGEVSLVKQKSDGKKYVLKKLDVAKVSQKEQKFAMQEAKLMSKLSHPNVVTYKDSFTVDGFLYICMGYCEGGDLHTKLRSRKGVLLQETQVVEWTIQIAFGLQYLHQHNILHRDLKTQNIFLTRSKMIKLGDLGIARVLDDFEDMASTVIGTPYYMSPELYSNVPYNHKSDIWALGCCVYEMATLRQAFKAKDINSLAYKVIRGKVARIPGTYSDELSDLVNSMLALEPEERPSVSKIVKMDFIKTHMERMLEESQKRKKVKKSKSKSRAAAAGERSGSTLSTHSSTSSVASAAATPAPAPAPIPKPRRIESAPAAMALPGAAAAAVQPAQQAGGTLQMSPSPEPRRGKEPAAPPPPPAVSPRSSVESSSSSSSGGGGGGGGSTLERTRIAPSPAPRDSQETPTPTPPLHALAEQASAGPERPPPHPQPTSSDGSGGGGGSSSSTSTTQPSPQPARRSISTPVPTSRASTDRSPSNTPGSPSSAARGTTDPNHRARRQHRSKRMSNNLIAGAGIMRRPSTPLLSPSLLAPSGGGISSSVRSSLGSIGSSSAGAVPGPGPGPGPGQGQGRASSVGSISSIGSIGSVASGSPSFKRPSMDGELELSSDDDDDDDDAEAAAAAETEVRAIGLGSPASSASASSDVAALATGGGGGSRPNPAQRSISPFLNYDSGGASGSEVEESNDDFGQYLRTTLQKSLHADGAPTEDWGKNGSETLDIEVHVAGAGADGTPSKSWEDTPNRDPASPPNAMQLPASPGDGDGDGGGGEGGGGLVTPARRPETASHGLRTPFEKRIDWLNRLLAAELADAQLDFAKQVLEEKDHDISEELPPDVEATLIEALGSDTFKITIDVLRQVVHLPKLLSRVNGIGRAVDTSN